MIRPLVLPVLVLFCLQAAPGGAQREIVVAQDGSGDSRTIQAVLDAIPDADTGRVVIFIRKGVYNEKIVLRRPYVTLLGEDRDSTRIVYAELRRNWVAQHGTDHGAATVTIDTAAHDVILANLTVYNNYGSIHGDHDHQFAIRGFGTRVILLGCAVLADGGDTVSLWDGETGMYYHAYCVFEGWVDYVCPRGWCHIRDSEFFGRNRASASFWHDGSRDRSQKFVIVDSFIDGVADFPLGRNHLDGQFFFVRCRFSANMADRPFYRPPSSPRPWQWGARHYFDGCHRTGGDFAWFADNLHQADPVVTAAMITARWTFDGRWDPEAAMPSLLPFAILPSPAQGAKRVPGKGLALRWTPARHADRQRVVLTARDGGVREFLVTGGLLEPGVLETDAVYRWRVDTITPQDTVRGKTWTFTTE